MTQTLPPPTDTSSWMTLEEVAEQSGRHYKWVTGALLPKHGVRLIEDPADRRRKLAYVPDVERMLKTIGRESLR